MNGPSLTMICVLMQYHKCRTKLCHDLPNSVNDMESGNLVVVDTGNINRLLMFTEDMGIVSKDATVCTSIHKRTTKTFRLVVPNIVSYSFNVVDISTKR